VVKRKPRAKTDHEATEENPKWWCSLIDAARSRRSETAGLRTAIEEAYTGRRGSGRSLEFGGVEITQRGTAAMTKVRPPRLYALAHGMEAMLFHRRPKFFVRAYTGRLEKRAQDLERLVNTMWPRFVGDKELRWIIRDTIKTGRGWGLLGFDFNEDEERSRFNERRRVARQVNESVLAQTGPTEELAATVEPLVPPAENPVEEENWAGDSRDRLRRPSFRRLPPGDVTYDPDARTMYDARWIDFRTYTDLASLKADPFFKGAEKVVPTKQMKDGKWGDVTKNNHVIQSPAEYEGGGNRGGMNHECYQYVEMHYTAVKRPGGTWDVMVYARDQEEFGRKLKAPYWSGCPFISLSWNDDGDSLESISDAERLLPGIVEEAGLRSRLKDHWNRKPNDVVAVDDRIFNNTSNKTAIEVQRTCAFIPVKVPTETSNPQALGNYFFPIPRNATIAEIYQHLQLIASDYEATTGLGPNQRLQALKSETSSFEAQEIARTARSRGIEKQEAVEDFCALLGHRLLMLAAQFFDAERAAEFVSGDAVQRWKTYEFSPGDVQDNLGVEVERGSMRPQSSDQREQWLSSLMQLALSNPAFAAKLNLEEIFNRIAEERGILDGSTLMNANVDLGQMVMAMMQMQLAGAGPKGGSAPKQPGGSTAVPS